MNKCLDCNTTILDVSRRCYRCYWKSMPQPFNKRFWKFVKKTPTCWIWIGGKIPSGYGLFAYKKVQQGAHRWSWIIKNGPIEKGLMVLHNCDNPACVNPKHLLLGTQMDNMRDKVFKQRQARGEKQGHAKLTWKEVTKIRALYKTGKYSQRKLASMFGVTQYPIQRIVLHKGWVIE